MKHLQRLIMLIVTLSVTVPLPSAFAQNQSPDHPTGLNFLDPSQYALLPKAQAPVSGMLPDSFTLETYLPRAQDQGQSNSCAAFAVTTNKAYRLYMASGRTGSPDDYLQSPSFPYTAACQRRPDPQLPPCAGGTLITDELEFLAEIGSLPLGSMPFRPNVCENWRQRIQEARNQSVTPFQALPDGRQPELALGLMKNLIVAGNPIIVGISACQEFQHPVNGYVRAFDSTNYKCGGHAILVVGYDDRRNAVRVLNSWGDGDTWRGSDNGKVWMSYDVFLRRYREGYVDRGPGFSGAFNGSYKAFAAAESSSGASSSASAEVTADILKGALRSNIGSKTGKTITESDGKTFDVARRYLWLEIPEQFGGQVDSVTYTLHDPTFRGPFNVKRKDSSIFLVWWKGWDCVDNATVEARLANGKTVKSDFNYCSLGQSLLPQ